MKVNRTDLLLWIALAACAFLLVRSLTRGAARGEFKLPGS